LRKRNLFLQTEYEFTEPDKEDGDSEVTR